jgi:hypothetical protein
MVFRVIPAKAGIQVGRRRCHALDSRFRGNDEWEIAFVGGQSPKEGARGRLLTRRDKIPRAPSLIRRGTLAQKYVSGSVLRTTVGFEPTWRHSAREFHSPAGVWSHTLRRVRC